MTGKLVLYLAAFFLIAVVFYIGWKLTSRSAYESAEYLVLQTDGSFEVREYPDLMMATTSTDFRSQGNDGSFGRLFKYISGSNESSSKIAMTTPVFMEPEGERSDGRMGFVIPKKNVATSIPHPSSATVEIQKRRGGQFAVVRFTGRMNDESREFAENELRKWMDAKALKGSKSVEFAGYDPPWTPGPFRRNELLIRLN